MSQMLRKIMPEMPDDQSGNPVKKTQPNLAAEGCCVSLDENGIPVIHAPPLEMDTSKLVPAQDFICTFGPCRHYIAQLIDGQSANRPEERHLLRWCSALHDETGFLDLRERTMYACSRYDPIRAAAFTETVEKRVQQNREDLEEAHQKVEGRQHG